MKICNLSCLENDNEELHNNKHYSFFFIAVFNATCFGFCRLSCQIYRGWLQKPQSFVQNFAARIISGKTKFEHITPSLKNLGWLPVKKAGLSPRCYFCIQVHDGLCPDLPDVTVCHKKADI